MTVTLGGITLSEHLLLTGIESVPMLAYSVEHTLGARAVVQYAGMDITSGIELRLSGEHHFTLGQQTAVLALVGQVVTLAHHRGTFSVLVVGMEMEPAIDYADPISADLYSGTITCITV